MQQAKTIKKSLSIMLRKDVLTKSFLLDEEIENGVNPNVIRFKQFFLKSGG
jgi:hypothetical protein